MQNYKYFLNWQVQKDGLLNFSKLILHASLHIFQADNVIEDGING